MHGAALSRKHAPGRYLSENGAELLLAALPDCSRCNVLLQGTSLKGHDTAWTRRVLLSGWLP